LTCRHKFFNTNNLWVNLPSLKATLDANKGVLQLPLIKNKKTINPRDSDTPAVFQLETAMGSAIECFDDAGAVVVPRDRFAPVKTCNDLFALRSDVYEVLLSLQNVEYMYQFLRLQTGLQSVSFVKLNS